MTITSADIEKVIALLREGRTQDADNSLVAAKTTLLSAESGGALTLAPPPPPRPKEQIIIDILTDIARRFGSPASLEQLIHEFISGPESSNP